MRAVIKNNAGFSLVELMVVVAIIGILAAIAVPNFQRFSAKAKQSEAKSSLSAIYGAEKAFAAEWQTHNGSFAVVGFKPTGFLKYRLQNAAFNANPTNYSGPVYAATDITTATYCGTNAIGGTALICGESLTGGVGATTPAAAPTMTNVAFLAVAGSVLYGGGPIDAWTVTQDKVFNNTVSGLP